MTATDGVMLGVVLVAVVLWFVPTTARLQATMPLVVLVIAGMYAGLRIYQWWTGEKP